MVHASRALAAYGILFQVSKCSPSDVSVSDLSFHVHKVDGGYKSLRVASLRDLGIQLIDLLKGETFGLIDEEVDEGDTDAAKSVIVSGIVIDCVIIRLTLPRGRIPSIQDCYSNGQF